MQIERVEFSEVSCSRVQRHSYNLLTGLKAENTAVSTSPGVAHLCLYQQMGRSRPEIKYVIHSPMLSQLDGLFMVRMMMHDACVG